MAGVFVYFVLSCFTLSVRAREAKKKRMWAKKKKDEGRKGRERHVHMIQPLHLMQVPFAPYCLSHCWKKAGDLPSLKRQLIPFPLARLFVCLFVFVRALCVCECVHVCSTSIQTTVAFACVQ